MKRLISLLKYSYSWFFNDLCKIFIKNRRKVYCKDLLWNYIKMVYTILDCATVMANCQLYPHNCHIPSNSTECKVHYSPQELELTETFCEKCKTGSLHITPTIVPRRVCRNNIRGTQ